MLSLHGKDSAMKDIFPKIPYFCDYPLSASLMVGIIVGFGVWWLRKRWRS
ncbi:hypothetical protein [Nostoc sp. CCY 9925]